MNKKWLLGGGVLAVVLVAAGVWFMFFKDDAPDAVSNDAANDQLTADLDNLDETTDTTEPAGDDDTVNETTDDSQPTVDDNGRDFDGSIDGTWVVNNEIGEFDFDTASGSFAGFRVAEELAVIGDTTAVGRSGGVTGTVTIVEGSLSGAEITVDMTAIVSNEARRESAIRRAVSATDFPTTTFVFDDAVDVSALVVGGEAMSFTVEGELTVKDITKPVTFEIEANVRDDGFGIITGSTEIVWEDFEVTPPSAAVVVSIADAGTVEFQLVVEQA